MRNYDPVSHVTVVGQSVFFGSSVEGAVHCLDSRTGREKWSFHADGPVRIALICPQGRVAPLLFNRNDGAPLGSLDGGGGCFVLLTDDARILHGPGNKDGWIQESNATNRSKIATFNGGTALVVRGNAQGGRNTRPVETTPAEERVRGRNRRLRISASGTLECRQRRGAGRFRHAGRWPACG
jgi:hypothetical protein